MSVGYHTIFGASVRMSPFGRNLAIAKACYVCNHPAALNAIECKKCERRSCFAERLAMRNLSNCQRIWPKRNRPSIKPASSKQALEVPPSSTAIGLSTAHDGPDISCSQAARLIGGGKLPFFSGNPEEWSMFISTFEETTRACGFSDGENKMRL
uniref:Uncharacterized protein n=1 Tax=Anopheles christyi TaxID=43041 RepID=A0A182KHA5_9DIPT